jgi:uncharacterized protein (DUF2147 family)
MPNTSKKALRLPLSLPLKLANAIVWVTLASMSASTRAEGEPIVGPWKTIDDKTNRPKSIIQIDLVDNQLQGKVIKLFREAGEDPTPVCEACKDHRKDKPVLGMTILSGLKKSSPTVWEGGEILDPGNGSVYKVKLALAPDGKSLSVRGYLGIPVLGRTQTWVRE